MKYLDQMEKIVAFFAEIFLMFEISCLLGLFLLTLFDIGAMATGISFRGGVEFGEYLLVVLGSVLFPISAH